MILPGPRPAPTCGLKTSPAPLGVRIGAEFGATCPEILTVVAGYPEAVTDALIAIWLDARRGVHVPEYRPSAVPTAASGKGGSPFVNVATIWADPTVLPQLSKSLIASGVGHEVGAEKLLTKPVWVGTKVAFAQAGPVAAG